MDYLNQLPVVEKLNGRTAIFLLGTDQYIGEGLGENGEVEVSETRVGIIPDQVAALKEWLESNGVALQFFFIKGAGTRAGFLDSAYLKIGGQALYENQLPGIPAPHVVHALKEPTTYEMLIPGPFLRIGALHFGAFDEEKGVAFLFKTRNFCAIFDGSNVGTEQEKPIRGSMSVFAGEIAAERTVEHFREKNIAEVRIVISGGGVVGQSALGKFIEIARDRISEIVIVEPNPQTIERIKEKYAGEPKVKPIQGAALTSDLVKNAEAVILTAVRGNSAPDVLMIDDIKGMADNSIIVDVSIDEKGGIVIPGFDRSPMSVSLLEVRQKNLEAIKSLGKNISYIADDHLPKRKPREASIAHGAAVMPYIAILLYFSAKLGGARQAAKYISEGDFGDQKNEKTRTLLQHLNRGLQFYCSAPIKYNKNVIENDQNKANLMAFFEANAIELALLKEELVA